MELVLHGEQEVLKEDNELLLQQILDNFFDTSHPKYNKQFALTTLCWNFNTSVDLCKECLHVKHQDELDQHDGYCINCDLLSLNSPNPELTLKQTLPILIK